MKIKCQIIKTNECFRLVMVTKTTNDTDVDHVQYADLDNDAFTSMLLMSHPFEFAFEGLEEVKATQAAIDAVKARQEAAAKARQEAAAKEAAEKAAAEAEVVEA